MKKQLAPLLSLLQLTNALPGQRIPDVLQRIKQQQRQEGVQLTQGGSSKGTDADAASDVETLYFDQRLDHFSKEDEGNSVNFKQRFFYTSRYVQSDKKNNEGKDKKKTLAFLCVGGEGPSLDTSVLVNSVHCTGDMIGLADKLFHEHNYDVHLFALEHRYYGESIPSLKSAGYLRGEGTEDADEDEILVDYTHLSSRQAVQDIVGFVKSPEALQHLNLSDGSEKTTWITFGGSYPGMLSAWSRLLHPEDIFAAVSSSAPIQAQLDFEKYHEHVGSDLEDDVVGGSKPCRAIVEEGHEQVVAILEGKKIQSDGEGDSSEDGLDQLATLFNICGGAETLRASRRNQEVFVGDGVIYVPAQSNDPSCEGDICDVKGLCDAMVKERTSNPNKSSMEILAQISNLQHGTSSTDTLATCNDINWKSYLDWYKTPTTQNANDLSWLYQTCSEFGFYQTCNKDSNCPYAKGYHDVSRDLELCQVAFGIEPDTVKKNIGSTLTYYGGLSLSPNTGEQIGPNGSSMMETTGETFRGQKRIIFVTGDVDPWTELSFTKEGSKGHPSISVTGASHHFWTHEIKDSDSKFVVDARQAIYDTVSDWLGESTNLVSSAEGATVVMNTQ